MDKNKIFKILALSILAIGFFIASIFSAINVQEIWNSIGKTGNQIKIMGSNISLVLMYWFGFASSSLFLIREVCLLKKNNQIQKLAKKAKKKYFLKQ